MDQSAQCRHGRGFIARRAARVASALMPALASALAWYLCLHEQNFKRSLQPEHEHSLSNSKPYKPSNIHNNYNISHFIFIFDIFIHEWYSNYKHKNIFHGHSMEHSTRIELYLYKTSQLEYKLILELLVISLSHAPNSLNTQLFYSLYGM